MNTHSMVALTECCVPHGASDEFMLYSFKVLPCTRKGAHSWTECAFTHAGEKAARRCPKTYIYSAEACPDARKSGKCARGDMCPYSHGVFEQWLHPSRYRTQLCSFGTACRRPVCFFAHTVQELRVPTACGPNPAAITTTPMQASAAAAAAAVAAASQMGLDPATAAVATAAAAQHKDASGYAALMQQAMLAQMTAAAHQQLDGATATMINRYQAASCAALANAAACQRQQQQHQAAAAAAAAAAMAAAANNPASLLHMAQAAQAYQAAAAAAAAAAANVHMPNNLQNAAAAAAANANGLMSPVGDNRTLGSLSNASQMISGSSRSSSSNVSSPTCSSSHNNGSLMSVSTFMTDGPSASDPAAQLPITSQAAGALFDNLLLQQALAGAAAGSNTWANGTAASPFSAAAAALGASPSVGAAGFGLPWLPSSSSALACGSYPSSWMSPTPAISDGLHNAASTAELARQLSMQQGF